MNWLKVKHLNNKKKKIIYKNIIKSKLLKLNHLWKHKFENYNYCYHVILRNIEYIIYLPFNHTDSTLDFLKINF